MAEINDLISRAALLELFVWKCCGECCGCEYEEKEKPYYCRLIKSAPAVDAVPVIHGRWIEENPDDFLDPRMRCSICKEVESPLMKWRYCPNCGAKMENNNE